VTFPGADDGVGLARRRERARSAGDHESADRVRAEIRAGGFRLPTSELQEKRHDQERLLSVRREVQPLGLGTWQMPVGPECVNAVRWALALGYRHIDTAQVYGNETRRRAGLESPAVSHLPVVDSLHTVNSTVDCSGGETIE
jgi:hypothetical protein